METKKFSLFYGSRPPDLFVKNLGLAGVGGAFEL
jgi:hypothetical protein